MSMIAASGMWAGHDFIEGRIIDILEAEGQIDNFSAINTRLTLRLGMHIHLLRQTGYEITTEELPDRNCVYRLVAAPKPQQLAITV